MGEGKNKENILGILKISFIGGGNMGQAMAAAVIKNHLAEPQEVSVSDISQPLLDRLKKELGVFTSTNNLKVAGHGEIIVLSVKPQTLGGVMSELSGKLNPKSLVFSIIAGKKMETLVKGLKHQAVVRAMPNTPAQIGKGVTVWTATPNVTPAQRVNAEAIVSVMGKGIYAGYESYLDLATAVSGSGPAYVFLFMEALMAAAKEIGMPEEMAKTLVFQTVLGSAEYAQASGKELAELRRNVTSPGGTTAEALKVFEQGDFTGLVKKAVAAAYRRAQELGS
jgi:pyrroline-5-carboxylate reductase